MVDDDRRMDGLDRYEQQSDAPPTPTPTTWIQITVLRTHKLESIGRHMESMVTALQLNSIPWVVPLPRMPVANEGLGWNPRS